MSIKNATEKQPCACCSIFFNSKICPQCQVAGCTSTVGSKKHKCRLQGTLVGVMQLTEFQVRQELGELKAAHAKLIEEAQRIALLLMQYEVKYPNPNVRETPCLDAAGVDPGSQRGKVSMLAGAH